MAQESKILKLRKEKAQLLGYASHAEISLATKMAPSVGAVDKLTAELRDAAKPKAQEDQDALVAFARKTTGDASLELLNWDIPFWAERMREAEYNLSDEELRPYFPFPKVLEGLFAVTKRLFDVDVVAADGETQVWNDDVRFFKVRSAAGEDIASFYLDPYSRPENKRGGAWMDNLVGRAKLSDGTIRLPNAVLVCNQTPPAGGRPSLMSHREVETLFHEFGHGLQHMLTTVDLAQAAGIESVEWDAVELRVNLWRTGLTTNLPSWVFRSILRPMKPFLKTSSTSWSQQRTIDPDRQLSDSFTSGTSIWAFTIGLTRMAMRVFRM